MPIGLKRHALLLGAASCLALGEGMPIAAGMDRAAAVGAEVSKPSDPAPDLDFGDDMPVTAKPGRPAQPAASAPAKASAPEPASRAWIYWALGLSAAAAGGAAWLAHDYLDGAQSPRRSTEEFTDAAP